MGNKRINIAYYTADWNRELVSVALHTVKKYLEQHPDAAAIFPVHKNPLP